MIETAAPIAASPPAVVPSTVVAELPLPLATALRSPLSTRAVPVPIETEVSLSAKVMPTAGVIDTFDPAVPTSALVFAVCFEVAASVMSLAPLSTAPFSIDARVILSVKLRPTDAPIPASASELSTFDLASTWLSEVLVASTTTSSSAVPSPASTVPAISASLVLMIRFRENDPAMPTADAPAPEIDFDSNLLLVSPLTSAIPAATLTPSPLTLAVDAISARLLVSTTSG